MPRSPHRRAATALATLVVAVAVTAGCSGGSGDTQEQQQRIDVLCDRIANLESQLSSIEQRAPATATTSSSGG